MNERFTRQPFQFFRHIDTLSYGNLGDVGDVQSFQDISYFLLRYQSHNHQQRADILQEQAGSRFVKAFTGIDVAPEGIVPTIGSMQACYNLLLECSQMSPGKDAVIYVNPGFSSHYVQANVLGLKTRMFDVYDNRGEAFGKRLEELMSDGRHRYH